MLSFDHCARYLWQSAYKTERFSKFQSMTDKPCSFGPMAKQQIAAGMRGEGSLFSSKLLQRKSRRFHKPLQEHACSDCHLPTGPHLVKLPSPPNSVERGTRPLAHGHLIWGGNSHSKPRPQHLCTVRMLPRHEGGHLEVKERGQSLEANYSASELPAPEPENLRLL